ncbi:MAG TPA: ABC transporter permease [Thermoanaerobaculia bacterium]|nr:ABC transporter permease [Thermoanaerobaculia bacterium]
MGTLADLKYAARALAREPGFTAVAVLTLALAIGANTAIFSVADGLLLKPLPLPRADRLMVLIRQWPKGEADSLSVPKFFFLRDRMQRELGRLAAYDTIGGGFNLAGGGQPERLRGAYVSRDFFATAGVVPALGRDFLPEEDRPGARRVVVLSQGLWTRRFGADPGLLGRQLLLNGEGYTVVGVMPRSFRLPSTAELWTPFRFDPASANPGNYFGVLGRLQEGVPLAAAAAKARALGRAFDAAFPHHLSPDESFSVWPLQQVLYGSTRPALLVLLAAVGAVLLIACVNIANLQLARAAARQREIAIRSALGAGSWRVVRQLLTESCLLALLGGGAGILLGAAAIRPLLAANPFQIDRLAEIGIDLRVLAFTLLLSLAAGVLFGLAPALQALRSNLHEPLKEGSNRTAGSAGGRLTRRLLVTSEVALALVLIISAALLMRSFVGLVATQPGFDSSQLLTMKLSLPAARYGSAAALERFSSQVLERIAALPGVRGAAAASTLPLEEGPDLPFQVEGRQGGGEDGRGDYNADYRALTPELLQVLRIPVLRGRGFTAGDRVGAPLVALLNETAARRAWPHENPIGRRIVIGLAGSEELADRGPRTVVGIVRDVHEEGVARKVPALLYVPLAQMPDPLAKMFVGLLPISVVARTGAASPGLTAAIEKQIWAVDPGQPITDVKTMDEIRAASLGTPRFTAVLLGLMALLALTLASVGIYGVLSYLVQMRRREIGIRMALGAQSAQVLGLVLSQGMGTVLIGIAAGLAGALAATRLLASQLVGVTVHDPLIYALTPVLLAAVAALASFVPARRASQLDPIIALHQE